MLESFILCRDYSPPVDYKPSMIDPLLNYQYGPDHEMLGANRVLVPFMACGDINGYDADQTYPLGDSYQHLEPIQKPINPPYKSFLERKQKETGYIGS
jgi:tRNA (cytidine32/guanosine34-2'-O)-methyltransferase